MPREKLHRTLNELRQELENTSSIDPDARSHLHSVMNEIRELLDRPADDRAESEGSSWVARLRSSVEHFEQDHPTIAKGMAELIAALRNMGF